MLEGKVALVTGAEEGSAQRSQKHLQGKVRLLS